MNFVGNFGYVVVCVVGAALALDGQIEFGVIVAFMMYVRLFTQPLAQFAQAFQNLQRCAAAAERVFGFPRRAGDGGRIRQVRLCFGTNGHEVKGDAGIQPRTVRLRTGKPIITTSPPPSRPGRRSPSSVRPVPARPPWSTCSCASMRISGGSIAIDGVDIQVRARAGTCTTSSPWCCRDTWVFRGTVRENIAYSSPA